MKKILIYLDNDDYSKLSNPVEIQKNNSLKEALANLRIHIENGHIEIRYSALNVMEIIHLDDKSKSFAVARAKLLNELTQNALLRPDILYLHEAKKLAQNLIITQDNRNLLPLATNNDWLGYTSFHPTCNFNAILNKEVTTYVKENTKLSRHDRRALISTRINKNGKLKNTESNHAFSMKTVLETDNTFGLYMNLKNYVCGKSTRKDFEASFSAVLNNAEKLVAQLLDASPEGRRKFIAFIRGYGKDLSTTLDELQNKVKDIENENPIYYEDKNFRKKINKLYRDTVFTTIENARKKILRNMYNEEKTLLKREKISSEIWEEKVVHSVIGQMPALDTMLLLAAEALYERLLNKKAFTSNDWRDFSHASYAPYCDIFRADKRTADLLKKIKDKVPMLANTFIAKKPEEIIIAIQNLTRSGF